ncbi:hypothetical protein KCG35_00295 [Zooshikella sp. WH53]|uniref:SGNH/GDSL hydrolase family protein n=1 Tax=Zooshikella harenae TaxID=2827238 RepID=A0ABS5Z609_9GAMM|nr:hypothetical protein [Zooshikella harenae]
MGIDENPKKILVNANYYSIYIIGSLDRSIPRLSYCSFYLYIILIMNEKLKEYTAIGLITLLLLAIALLILRYLSPGLLGKGTDLQLVQIDKKVPPFFDNIFREEDIKSVDFLIQDPVFKVRAKPLLPEVSGVGPHDILGFRNFGVPNQAEIVIVGDSQTYGNNAPIIYNWPHIFNNYLASNQKYVTQYAMATGGWGAIQYFEAARNASVFQPIILIVAFYTGNDPLESFSLAYGSDLWVRYRLDTNLSSSDAPMVEFPEPKKYQWPVNFSDGVSTIFTPKLRGENNLQSPVVDVGYKIMLQVAKDIRSILRPLNIKVFYTIIPTKELVYKNKINAEVGLDIPAHYKNLITNEETRIKWLSGELSKLGAGSKYVDIVEPLQVAASRRVMLYPKDGNGHPVLSGYSVIAQTIADTVAKALPEFVQGFALANSELYSGVIFINKKNYWMVFDRALISNMDTSNLPTLTAKELKWLKPMGNFAQVKHIYMNKSE